MNLTIIAAGFTAFIYNIRCHVCMNEYLKMKIAILAALSVSSIFNARVNQNTFTVENVATSSESKVADDK